MEPSKRPANQPAAGNSPMMPRQDAGARPSTSSALLTFLCHLCSLTFTRAWDLTRHIRSQHGNSTHICPICDKSFARKDNLDHHVKTCASKPATPDLTCHDCQKTFKRRRNLTQHLKTHVLRNCDECGKTFQTKVALTAHAKTHKTVPLAAAGDPKPTQDPRAPPSAACPPEGCKSALKGAYERYRARGIEDDIDLHAFLQAQNHVDLIRDALRRKKSIKFFISANIILTRPRTWITRGDPESRPYFTSRCHRVLEAVNIVELLETSYAKITEAVSEYLKEGSGWIIKQINFVDLVISTYTPLNGSSYIQLPPKLCHPLSVVNVKNADQKCFLWAILSALHPATDNPHLASNYIEHEHSLNLGGLTFPILSDDIPTFEKLNNLHINLFGFLDGEVFPIYITEKTTTPINLLLIFGVNNQHYCWIRDFNMFMDSVSGYEFSGANVDMEGSSSAINWF